MLRLANAEVLPVDFNSFYKTLSGYVAELKTMLDNSRTESDQLNNLVKNKLFDLAKDPRSSHGGAANHHPGNPSLFASRCHFMR